MDKPIQTRNEDGALEHFATLAEAFEHAKKDETVWKISFFVTGLDSDTGRERVRLVKVVDDRKIQTFWVYEPIVDDKSLGDYSFNNPHRLDRFTR